jgi:hypothetical protein
MCGKAVPFRFCLIKLVGGYAAQSLHTLHGEAKPDRTSGGRAAKLRLLRKVSYINVILDFEFQFEYKSKIQNPKSKI